MRNALLGFVCAALLTFCANKSTEGDATSDTASDAEPDTTTDTAEDLVSDPDVLDQPDLVDDSPEVVDDSLDAEPDVDPSLCPDGYPRGEGSLDLSEIARFTPAPEGVTVCPGGDVFVSLFAAGEIWILPADGSDPELYTDLGDRGPAGLTCDDDGRLYAADFGGSGGLSSGCVRIDHAGHAGLELPTTVGTDAFSAPNGIVWIPGQGVYMSDSTNGWIVRFTEDTPDTYSVQLVDSGTHLEGFFTLTGVNGLAYHTATSTLWVAVSTNPVVLNYPMNTDGSLGTHSEIWNGGGVLQAVDGVAVDENSVGYSAKYVAGDVVRLSDDAVVASITNPASLAFKGGSLLMTSYVMGADVEGALYALDIGACGGL